MSESIWINRTEQRSANVIRWALVGLGAVSVAISFVVDDGLLAQLVMGAGGASMMSWANSAVWTRVMRGWD